MKKTNQTKPQILIITRKATKEKRKFLGRSRKELGTCTKNAQNENRLDLEGLSQPGLFLLIGSLRKEVQKV